MAQRVGLADQLGPDRVLATIDATNGWPLRPQVGAARLTRVPHMRSISLRCPSTPRRPASTPAANQLPAIPPSQEGAVVRRDEGGGVSDKFVKDNLCGAHHELIRAKCRVLNPHILTR